MTIRRLKNISISQFESFLELVHCKHVPSKSGGGHIKYTRCDCLRPIIFQSHIEPVPEFIIKNNLRVLGYSKDDFFDVLDGVKEIERIGNKFSFKK